MSHAKEKLDIFSDNLLVFEADQAGSSQTVYSDVVHNTRKRKMTEKGLEYAITTRKKVALSKAQEFKSTLYNFRVLIATMRSQDELKNELKRKIEQFGAALQAFDDYSQLIVDPLESRSVIDAQNELRTMWEGPQGVLKFSQECLRSLEDEDTRSISSRVTQKSFRSRGSSRNTSTSTKDTLISIKAKKAVLQERLKFTDVIKEQEKTLSKLKLEQELSETLAEEAIYEAEVSEESIIPPIPYLPKDSFTTLNRFLNSEPSPSMIVSQPTSDVITSETVPPLLVTTTTTPLFTPPTEKPCLNTTDYVPTSANVNITTTPAPMTSSVNFDIPSFAPTSSTISPMNTWTTYTPFVPKMATSTHALPKTTSSASTQHVLQNSHEHNPAPDHRHFSDPPFMTDPNSTQDEIVRHSQQLIEALAKVTQIQRLPQAKANVYRGDEKDKVKYFLWEKAFDALVDSAPVTDIQKLHLLYQHLDGRAKKVVEQLQYMIEDPAKAYNEARKILKERFGYTAFLETDFENKLTNWPRIGNNDAQGLQEFGDFLQQVKIANQYIPNLKIFEYPSKSPS